MKRIILLLLLFALGVKTHANIMITPYLEISELAFNDSTWVLEIRYFGVTAQTPLDSVRLTSTTSSVLLNLQKFDHSSGYVVLTQEDLDEEFVIMPKGDIITLYNYNSFSNSSSTLTYGDKDEAEIGAPNEGQSIAYFWSKWVKCNSPSFGMENTTIGSQGTWEGRVFNMDGSPVKNFRFSFIEESRATDEEGFFSTKVMARPHSIDSIYASEMGYFKITPISFTLEPDSIVYKDISITQDFRLSIPSQPITIEQPIKLFPNPVEAGGQINYQIDLPIRTAQFVAQVVTMDGRIVKAERIVEQSGSIAAPNHAGMYIFRIRMGNRTLSSERIVVE